MKIEFYTQFEKQFDKLASGSLKGKVSNAIKNVMDADSLSEIKIQKKLRAPDYVSKLKLS